MKKGLLMFIALIALNFTANAQDTKINWMTMNEALDAQAKNPKKIMMDAYTDWCGPCKMLDKNTFQNPDVVKYVNEHYYAVKFNAEGEGDISTTKDRIFLTQVMINQELVVEMHSTSWHKSFSN